jgi:hypothetical protein
MDQGTLATLKHMIRPISLDGTLTLEQASSVGNLNSEVARFHAAVTQTERILALAGVVDDRLEHELMGWALRLTRRREELAGRGRPGGAPPPSAPEPSAEPRV